MLLKRVFKTKTFGRWARKNVKDSALCDAAREIEAGNFEADLGGGVCKKRVATQGRGKSRSMRTLVAKKSALAIIFLVGREKSEPKSDFSSEEEIAAKLVAKAFESATTSKLSQLAQAGSLIEICTDNDEHDN
jgi:hypothetical protein